MKYIIVAKIFHKNNGNLIITRRNEEMFEKYNKVTSKCEHCNTIRRRNVSFILENQDTKELIQVGSSCVDYYKKEEEMSLEEKAVFSSKEELKSIFDLGYIPYGNDNYISVDNVLLAMIHSKKDPKEKGYEVIDLIKLHKSDFNKKDYETLEAVKSYFEKLEPKNNFVNNVKVLVEEYYVSGKEINIVKWAYQLYKNDILYKEKNNTKGLENERFTIKSIWLEREYNDTRYSYYGSYKYVWRIIDENDNIIQYETTSDKDFTTLLNKEVVCKIKNQFSSKMGKVTIITNLKKGA